ncbi:unnamed protein product, partial [Amoebophrya sp. A25]
PSKIFKGKPKLQSLKEKHEGNGPGPKTRNRTPATSHSSNPKMNATGRRDVKEYINDKVRTFPWLQHNIETSPALKKEVVRMCTQAYFAGKQLRKAEFQTGMFEPFYLAHVESEAEKLGITKTLNYTDTDGNLQTRVFLWISSE